MSTSNVTLNSYNISKSIINTPHSPKVYSSREKHGQPAKNNKQPAAVRATEREPPIKKNTTIVRGDPQTLASTSIYFT